MLAAKLLVSGVKLAVRVLAPGVVLVRAHEPVLFGEVAALSVKLQLASPSLTLTLPSGDRLDPATLTVTV